MSRGNCKRVNFRHTELQEGHSSNRKEGGGSAEPSDSASERGNSNVKPPAPRRKNPNNQNSIKNKESSPRRRQKGQGGGRTRWEAAQNGAKVEVPLKKTYGHHQRGGRLKKKKVKSSGGK